MRHAWIITAAAFCGFGAFIYTLAVGKTERPRDRRSGGNMMMNSRLQALPETVEGLEQVIEQGRQNGRSPSARAHFALARRYEDADRTEDAARMWARAAELRLAGAARNPENPDVWFEAGWSLWKLGRLDEARHPMTQAERFYTLLPMDHRTAAMWYRLGWSRKVLGQDQDAAIAWSRARDAAQQATDEWGGGRQYNLACYHALLGENEAALSALEKAVVEGWNDAGRAMHDDDLKPLRDEDRFLAAVQRMREAPQGARYGPL